MKTKAFLLCLVLGIGSSCELYLYEFLFTPEGNNTALVTRVQYVSHTSSELMYETDVTLLNNYEFLDDITYLYKEEFQFLTATGSIEVLDFKTSISITAPPGKSSNIFMIDQSGSYEEVDAPNARSQMISKFLNDNQAPDTYMVAAFAQDGNLAQEPVEYFDETFRNDWSTPLDYIFGLVRRTGGTSPLYDALADAIDKFSLTGTNEQRELITLVHSSDDASVTTPFFVLQKAAASGVRLHFIQLGKQPSTALAGLAQSTGGLYVSCPTSGEMVTALNHLERLLNGTSRQYRIRVRYKPSGGSIQSGSEFLHTIQVVDSYDAFKFNPAHVYIRVP